MKSDRYIVIGILILILLNVYQWINPRTIVLDGDRKILIERIINNQKRLDSIEATKADYERERMLKLDSISNMIHDINSNIIKTKDLERHEKQDLFNASDADNMRFFLDYVNEYRTGQNKTRDTIYNNSRYR